MDDWHSLGCGWKFGFRNLILGVGGRGALATRQTGGLSTVVISSDPPVTPVTPVTPVAVVVVAASAYPAAKFGPIQAFQPPNPGQIRLKQFPRLIPQHHPAGILPRKAVVIVECGDQGKVHGRSRDVYTVTCQYQYTHSSGVQGGRGVETHREGVPSGEMNFWEAWEEGLLVGLGH